MEQKISSGVKNVIGLFCNHKFNFKIDIMFYSVKYSTENAIQKEIVSWFLCFNSICAHCNNEIKSLKTLNIKKISREL